MRADNPIRILIADDHPIVRMGLAALIDLHEDMQVVAQAGDGKEAVELFRQHRPDVSLLDLIMPQMDGIEATEAIRAEYPSARIIILTTYQTEEDIYRSLRAGAYGYLRKDVPGDDLVKAIRAVHAGQRCIPPEAASKLSHRLSGSELTQRETEVLRAVIAGKSTEEIAASLYIAEATVKTHMTNILGKLGVSDRTQAAIAAIRRGIIRID